MCCLKDFISFNLKRSFLRLKFSIPILDQLTRLYRGYTYLISIYNLLRPKIKNMYLEKRPESTTHDITWRRWIKHECEWSPI